MERSANELDICSMSSPAIADHPIIRFPELLPWHWAAMRKTATIAA
jgi:hypothetical protein